MKKAFFGIGAMTLVLGSVFMANANQTYSVKVDPTAVSIISLPLTSNLYDNDDNDEYSPEPGTTTTTTTTRTTTKRTTTTQSLASL
ncbi:hypothetical protein [Sphingobacterium anhuiense]|uniref:Uncharacterized protein n=1 Tax=Sphingobacterium anhuiense TaxID=493780 RepID=A0ABW5YZJ9_9SPHI